MAAIGQTLTAPEPGWKRYDNTDSSIVYDQNWSKITESNNYNGGKSYSNTLGATLKFNFIGTKFRIISYVNSSYTDNVSISFDGEIETFSEKYSSTIFQSLVFEKSGLDNKLHQITITNAATGYIGIDAIDIDDTGSLIAQVGSQLTAPEVGWKRYDSSDPTIIRIGAWTTSSNSSHYNGSTIFADGASNSIKFKFVGSKLRLIDQLGSNRSTGITITIDSNSSETFSQYSSSDKYQIVCYENQQLDYGEHLVVIQNGSGRIDLDAIDIDDTGYLMAFVGSQLVAPEPGWKRYDADIIPYRYGTWQTTNGGANRDFTGGSVLYSGTVGDYIKFYFVGSMIRFTAESLNTYDTNIEVTIDGVTDYMNLRISGSSTYVPHALVYEKVGLLDRKHEVIVKKVNNNADYFHVDAIDIDSNGRLFHPDEVTNIKDLDIGKRIRCHYTAVSNSIGTFNGLGQEASDFIPAGSSATPNGDFYFIMVEDWNQKKLLIADRNIQGGISWDVINATGISSGSGAIIGIDNNLHNINYTLRLLTGGSVSSADKDNEWDKYIVNSTLNGTITAGNNSVWNWNVPLYSWTSTTSTQSNTRVVRGYNSATTWFQHNLGTATTTNVGFRPVLIIEILPLQRSFISVNGKYKIWTDNQWETISTTLPSEETFVNEGMDDLSIFDRKLTTFEQDMSNNGTVGSGRVMKSTVNLKKYFDLKSLVNDSETISLIAFDALNKGSGVTLSNNNLTATVPNNSNRARADLGRSTGKWYWEIRFDAGSSLMTGVANAAAGVTGSNSINTRSYYSSNGNKYSDTGSVYGSTYAPGDTISVLIDLDIGTIEFWKNGVSQGIAFTNVKSMGTIFPTVFSGNAASGITATAGFNVNDFQYEMPDGYLAYDGSSYFNSKVLILANDKLYTTPTNSEVNKPINATADKNYSSSYSPLYLFDDNLNTAWNSTNTSGVITYIFNEPVRISSYDIVPWSIYLDRSPKDWIVQVSNDNSAWNNVSTISGQTGWRSARNFQLLDEVGNEKYKYYRFNFTSNNGNQWLAFLELTTYVHSVDKIIVLEDNNMNENNFLKYGVGVEDLDIKNLKNTITQVKLQNVSLDYGKTFEHSIGFSKRKVDKITFD